MLLACATLPAAAAPITLGYDIYVGGLTVLSFDVRVELTPDGPYRVEAKGNTRGMIDWVVGWQTDNLSEGRMEKAAARPVAHHAVNLFRGSRRTVDLAFTPGQPVAATIVPSEEEDDRDPVPPALTIGAIDPLSALVETTLSFERGEKCARTLKLFDGRRRFDAIITDQGEEVLKPTRYGMYQGASTLCGMQIKRIAGYSRHQSDYDKPEDHDHVTQFWIARPVPELPPLPVRIEGKTGVGYWVVHLARVGAAAP